MSKSKDQTPKIAIAGCGFAAIGLAFWLKKAGFDNFTIYERSADLGGVWRDNHYPGAACDVPSRFYSYSFEQDYRWSAPYGTQSEILEYQNHCARKYGVMEHIQFSTEITGANFDDATGKWRIETSGGEEIEADLFVSAVGLFNQIAYPDIEGREKFGGAQFHSAHWDDGLDLTGKTVAVIGTGASAVQFVPAIQPKVAKLHLFQRTPQYVTQRMIPDHTPDGGTKLARRWERLCIYWQFEMVARRRISTQKTAEVQAGFMKYLEAQVPDADLRAKLTPDYRFGCKRVLQSNDWYPALQQPNVEVVTTPVQAITETGVKTSDGELRDVDAIIYGTGFVPTDFLNPMNITGIAGRQITDAWAGGAEAYLGLTVSGFPNFFMMYGPNTNTASSIIFMLENQARYIVKCVKGLVQGGAKTMNLRADVQKSYNEELQARIGKTVLMDANCHTYFQDPSGKVTTQWPGHLIEYRYKTRRVKKSDYDFA
ncbi:MAG: NAD(P)/FAD-dependent oxidoreductase [Rhodospirillales bacterium]|nr:NAD(P)/FAD-dependent oxidoreductase [Rhodospirillales bacterium]